MDIKFEPPRLQGTPEQKLHQLEAWVRNLCEKLNIAFDEREANKNGRS